MVNSFAALDNKEEEQVEKDPKKAHDSSCKSWVESSFGKQKSPAPKDTIAYDGEDAENSGQHVLQVENENQTKNWTLVAHKKSTSSRILPRLVKIILHVVKRVQLRIFMIVRRGKILVMSQETYYFRIALMLY